MWPLSTFGQRRPADPGVLFREVRGGRRHRCRFSRSALRVLEPSIRLTLLDSLNKRIQFLETVCRELDLPDVACVHARAEEFAAEHRETFDLAVSRAVAALPVLCELCLPLVKPGGKFLAMKSVESDAELAALTARHCDPGRRRGGGPGLCHPRYRCAPPADRGGKVKKLRKNIRECLQKSRRIPL